MNGYPALALALLAAPAYAQTTHYVDTAGRCDGLAPCHTTIMAAVDAAADGDTVAVFPGVYGQRVELTGRRGLALVAYRTDAGGAVCAATPRPERARLTAELFVDLHEDVRVEGLVLGGGATVLRGNGSAFVGNQVDGPMYLRMCHDTRLRNNAFHGGLTAEAAGSCTVEDNAFNGGGLHFSDQNNADDNAITGNVFRDGDLHVGGNRSRRNRIRQNRLFDGDLRVTAAFEVDGNVVEGNVVRRGGLHLMTGSSATGNRIHGNGVFDSDGDGLRLEAAGPGTNEVRGNTSRGHAGCDIVEPEDTGMDNTWADNEFDTACGAADG